MKAIEQIAHENKLYAIIVRHTYAVGDGVRFLTPEEFPLQLGVIERPRGYSFRPHIHKDMHYNVNTTQEFLYIEKGRLKLKLFTHAWELFHETELAAGDFVLTVTGGHAFEVLEDSRLIEVKQGPYPGDDYAKRFKA